EAIGEYGDGLLVLRRAPGPHDEVRATRNRHAVCFSQRDLRLDFPEAVANLEDVPLLVVHQPLFQLHRHVPTAQKLKGTDKLTFQLALEQTVDGDGTQSGDFLDVILTGEDTAKYGDGLLAGDFPQTRTEPVGKETTVTAIFLRIVFADAAFQNVQRRLQHIHHGGLGPHELFQIPG